MDHSFLTDQGYTVVDLGSNWPTSGMTVGTIYYRNSDKRYAVAMTATNLLPLPKDLYGKTYSPQDMTGVSLMGFNPLVASTAQRFMLGETRWDRTGGAWVYVQTSEAVEPKHCTMFQRSHIAQHITTARLNATADEGTSRLGMPIVNIADDDYGWVQVYGNTVGLVTGAITNREQYSYSTSTVGEFDDGTGGHRTRNVIFQNAPNAAGDVQILMNWPGGVRFV